MAQVFDRSSNALARASLVLTGLVVVVLGVTLDQLQRSPWVTRQGQRADQPIPFSHKHHVEGLGLQCQYCHTTVEVSSYAGIPPTKTCINCHSQIWTNAALLQPVRDSWATGRIDPVDQGARPSRLRLLQPRDPCEQGDRMRQLPWPRGPDAPDVHGEHVADGVVPELPSQPGGEPAAHQRDLQHGLGRNPPPISPCGARRQARAHPGPAPRPRAWPAYQKDPSSRRQSRGRDAAGTGGDEDCSLTAFDGAGQAVSDGPPMAPMLVPASYRKFTSQIDLGRYLTSQYHIRPPNELTSCETCHR
jgi:hypothetical protein